LVTTHVPAELADEPAGQTQADADMDPLGETAPEGSHGMQASVEMESLYVLDGQSEHTLEASGPWPVAHETEVAIEKAALVHSSPQKMFHVPLGGVREVDVT